jgi:hypothetical protein
MANDAWAHRPSVQVLCMRGGHLSPSLRCHGVRGRCTPRPAPRSNLKGLLIRIRPFASLCVRTGARPCNAGEARVAERDCLENRNRPYCGVSRAGRSGPTSSIWSSWVAGNHVQRALLLFSRQSLSAAREYRRQPSPYRSLLTYYESTLCEIEALVSCSQGCLRGCLGAKKGKPR